jgi:hypothetical protein
LNGIYEPAHRTDPRTGAAVEGFSPWLSSPEDSWL